jgi:hypothetical protein
MQARAAPESYSFSSLIGKHALKLGLIGRIGDNSLTKLPLSGARFRCQNVPRKRMTPGYFACTRLFEAFGRTLMGL